MTEVKLTKRYPQSRTEDIVDAYMRGWNDALDAVQNGKFIINDDRKTENSSEKPNNCEDEFFREPTAEERKAVADYIDSISVPTGVNVFDFMDEPQTTCNWCKFYDGENCYCSSDCEECKGGPIKTEPQRDCFLCKWLGKVDVCGRCRNRNLFAEADTEPQTEETEMERVMDRDLNSYTLEELQSIENYNEEAVFNSIILVPMEELHDSGFRCMKGILVNRGEIVGSVGGWCDVVHPNGIGNYGRYSDSLSRLISSGLIPYMKLSMDCLDKSHCIRIMLGGEWQMDKFIGSDLCFYKSEHTELPQTDCSWK